MKTEVHAVLDCSNRLTFDNQLRKYKLTANSFVFLHRCRKDIEQLNRLVERDIITNANRKTGLSRIEHRIWWTLRKENPAYKVKLTLRP